MFFSIGEVVIDIFEQEKVQLLGGTSANFCATISALGGKTAIITNLGEENWAEITNQLSAIGIDTSHIKKDPIHPTGKVMLSSITGKSLCEKRKFCADCFILEQQIDAKMFKNTDVLHFCSFALTECDTKYATKKAVDAVFSQGGKIAFDINFRPKQWKDKAECVFAIENILPQTHYLKASEEELKNLYDNQLPAKAVASFFALSPSLNVVILTKGEQGSMLYTRSGEVFCSDIYNTNIVDTTGAGDCLFASAVYLLATKKISHAKDFQEIINFSSASASLKLQKLGGIATHTVEQIKNLMATKK